MDGEQWPGYNDLIWDRRDNRGRVAAAGVYFCQLQAPGCEAVKKAVLARSGSPGAGEQGRTGEAPATGLTRGGRRLERAVLGPEALDSV